MKKMLKRCLVFLMCIVLSGCVKYNVTMEVNNDKSVTLEIIYGMKISDEILDDVEDDNLTEEDSTLEDDIMDEEESTDSDIDVEDYKYLAEQGFKVEKFTEKTEDATFEGVKVTKTYANIDDITSDEKIVVDFQKMFEEDNDNDKIQFFYKKGNKYVASFVFDFTTDDDMDYSSYQSMFDMKYTIKLPEKSSSNNATTVSADGKELTWNLTYGAKNDVNFEFTLNEGNILIFVAGGAILLVVIVVVFLVFKNKKNKKKIVVPVNEPVINPVGVTNVGGNSETPINPVVSNNTNDTSNTIGNEDVNNIEIIDILDVNTSTNTVNNVNTLNSAENQDNSNNNINL